MEILRVDVNKSDFVLDFIKSLYGEDAQRYFNLNHCNPSSIIFIARKNEQIVGTVCIFKSRIDVALWGLSFLVVLPEFRRQGIATALIKECEQTIIKCAPYPQSILLSAYRPDLYLKLGYTRICRANNNYLMFKAFNGN